MKKGLLQYFCCDFYYCPLLWEQVLYLLTMEINVWSTARSGKPCCISPAGLEKAIQDLKSFS